MERRKHYRIEGGHDVGLEASIQDPSGNPVTAEVIDLSAGGTSLRFLGFTPPALAVGDRTVVRFEAPQVQSTVEAAARVAWRTEDPDGRRYGFEFTDLAKLQAALASIPAFRRLFNRRETYRVKPDAAAPVKVILRADRLGAPQRVRLEDISSTGARLRIPIDLERTLVTSTEIELNIHLPAAASPLALRASVRHRELDGDDLAYGVMFIDDRGEPLRSPAIDAYVMDRQRQLIRRRRAG